MRGTIGHTLVYAVFVVAGWITNSLVVAAFLIALQNPDLFSLRVELSYIHTSESGANYGLLMAGAAMAAVPMILFFFACQKYFMQGLRIGAVRR